MNEEEQPEAQFNIDEIELATSLHDARQDGNYLVGMTEKGVRFRHRIPAGKMLSKNDKGDFILVDLRMV